MSDKTWVKRMEQRWPDVDEIPINRTFHEDGTVTVSQDTWYLFMVMLTEHLVRNAERRMGA